MKKLMCAIMMAAAATTALAKEVSISYQGQLKDGKGLPLPLDEGNTKKVDFRIYVTQTGGEALWGRCCTIAPDTNGYFNIELSDTSGSPITGNSTSNRLEDVLAKNARAETLFLGLTVEGSSGEIAPRQKLLSVPVAAFALDANQANGDFTVSGIATVNGPLVAKDTLQVSGKAEIHDMDVSGTLRLSGKAAHLQTAFGEDVVPVGVIVMWSGSVDDIPNGWVLCDGQKKTPDLRGRFIVGVNPNNNKNDKRDAYEPGNSGGNESITLSVEQIPAHSHRVPLNWGWSYDDVGGARYWRNTGSGGGSDSRTTDNTGGGKPHENRPPYYALCFIMKVSEASEKEQ